MFQVDAHQVISTAKILSIIREQNDLPCRCQLRLSLTTPLLAKWANGQVGCNKSESNTWNYYYILSPLLTNTELANFTT